MSNLVSVIIPVYNHEPELKEALASIAAQTYKNVEVIVVDDGSEGEIRKLGNEEIKGVLVKLIRQENKGAPAARNRGLQEANGEYVIFWDADVVGEPQMLEKMYQMLQDHPEASYAYCNFYFGRKKIPARAFASAALRENNFIHTTSLIRRAALSGRPWDESLKRFQDWDLWLTLLEQKKIGIDIPEYLFRVIPHQGGMSSWLPSFAYRAPWRWAPGIQRQVREYKAGRAVVAHKHGLNGNNKQKQPNF